VTLLLLTPPLTLPDEEPIRHECYHNSLVFILSNPDWTLVHGTPIGGPNFNERIGHAWAEIEHEGLMWVYDPTSSALLPAFAYYAGGQINYTVRYSPEIAFIMALREQTPGPWDDVVIGAAHVDRPEVFWKPAPVKKRKRISKKKRLDKRSR
jgi:hypothetical protein